MVVEMLIRVGESGKSKEATVTSVGAIRTKYSGYRSVHCSGTRHSGSVIHTAEGD